MLPCTASSNSLCITETPARAIIDVGQMLRSWLLPAGVSAAGLGGAAGVPHLFRLFFFSAPSLDGTSCEASPLVAAVAVAGGWASVAAWALTCAYMYWKWLSYESFRSSCAGQAYVDEGWYNPKRPYKSGQGEGRKKQRTLEAFPVDCFIIGYEGMQRIHLS